LKEEFKMEFIKALQLFSIREETAKDFVGSLEKVAKLGYDAVEFAGYGELSAKEMKSHLDRVGLKVYGSHVGYDRLINNLDEEIEYNLTVNNGYIVLPGYGFENANDFKKLALTLNVIGEKCKKVGIQLCYHNHSHEFKSFDCKLGMDILLDETEPSYLKAEIDTYWVQYAGINVVEYVGK
jgi:sugar phosphate isomerase/epimerase